MVRSPELLFIETTSFIATYAEVCVTSSSTRQKLLKKLFLILWNVPYLQLCYLFVLLLQCNSFYVSVYLFIISSNPLVAPTGHLVPNNGFGCTLGGFDQAVLLLANVYYTNSCIVTGYCVIHKQTPDRFIIYKK